MILLSLRHKELRWRGHFLIIYLFIGEHILRLEDHGDGTTTLIHEEFFSGLLDRIIYLSKTEKGFHLMNRALKQSVEPEKLFNKKNPQHDLLRIFFS